MVDETETLGGSFADVRAFCAIVEFGTVTAAAQHLRETKGSISRRVSRLERRLGTTLLARTPRAVSPTEEGNAFYSKASEALRWMDDAVQGARQSQEVLRGYLRVTAPIDMGVDVLPRLVVQFRKLHPGITVELLITDASLDLAANRIDLALRASVEALPDMGYRASRVASFHIGLYASPAYLADNAGGPDTPSLLSEYAWVASREFAGASQLQLNDNRGRSEQVLTLPTIRASDYASVHRLVLAGGGIGAIPSLVAAGSVATGNLVPVLPEWNVAKGTLYAVSLGGRDAPARVRVFREFVRMALDETW